MFRPAKREGARKNRIAARCFVFAVITALAGALLPWRAAGQGSKLNPTVAGRVQALVKKLTRREKIALLGGYHEYYTTPIPRLGIPAFKMSDGPMGPRNYGPATAFPAGISLAATWDRVMARRMGRAMGILARARGVDFLLAPAVNIQRVPVGGRNFEYYSEDPYLAGQIAAPFIEGVQSQGVIATVKHFAANNQEYQRQTISAQVSERALHEIYLPAFKAAIEEGHAWAVMAAYNKINGVYATNSRGLLTDILRKKWGFRGLVMSDWGATHNGVAAARAGLDLEMPSALYMNAQTLLPALRSGKIPPSVINAKVRRLLRAAISMGFFDHKQLRPETTAEAAQVKQVALEGAQEGIVLLANRHGALPFDRQQIHSLAVLGPNANPAVTGGGGSSYVTPRYAISVLDGLKSVAGPAVRVDYLPFRVGKEGSQAARRETEAERVLAAKDDAAIVCVGFNPSTESEGFDRTFRLPEGQDELIETVERANPKTIVILNSGGAVDMNHWLAGAAAVIEAWYPGSEGGEAVAQILFGRVDPSGKLPATFERHWGDSEADRTYPGSHGTVIYKEGIFVGYRYFERAKVQPLFPFGYGLSYTTFHYRDLQIRKEGAAIQVTFWVKNTGREKGAEIAEVYVGELDPVVPRPPKELKGFRRVLLTPGEEKEVRLRLPASAFAYYDQAMHGWKVQPDRYRILVGASSRDIRLAHTIAWP